MDIDSNPLFTQDLFSLKKRFMAFSALTENAIRLCSAYERFKNEPYHLSLGMSILEEELICSRFLHKLFQFDVKTSTCDLKEIVLMITEITMDSFFADFRPCGVSRLNEKLAPGLTRRTWCMASLNPTTAGS